MTAIIRNKGEYLQEFLSDYTIVDIETTGLSPVDNEIIELSAIKVRNDNPVAEFTTLVKPEGRIGSFITKLTGISNEMVHTAPTIKEVLPEFLKFVENDCIMGHNVNFDINFIYDNLFRHFQKEFSNNYIDTMRLARKHCKFKTCRLSYLAEQFQISTEGHHRALNDCNITLGVYRGIKKASNTNHI